MEPIKTSLKDYIQKQHLIRPGDKILVGVSGGADSVSLIYLLNALKHEFGITLHIAHFNHNLRKGALSDQKFVESVAKKLNIPCSIGVWKGFDKTAKGSLEDIARKKRFEFLFKSAKNINTQKVALAHNKDDLAETILMYLLRGTGLNGIRGILPKRYIDGYTVIRPLLNTPRKDIEAFVKKNGIRFRKDPTNDETVFFRNRIRHELLPLLEKKYKKNIKELLSNLGNSAAADYEYLTRHSDSILKKIMRPSKSKKMITLDLEKFKKQDASIKRMIIRRSVELLRGNTKRLTLQHCIDIEGLLETKLPTAYLNMPLGIKVEKKAKTLNFIYK